MVVPPLPQPPHFAAYIRQFHRKLDSCLDGSIRPQTGPLTTTRIYSFFLPNVCGKTSIFIKSCTLASTRITFCLKFHICSFGRWTPHEFGVIHSSLSLYFALTLERLYNFSRNSASLRRSSAIFFIFNFVSPVSTGAQVSRKVVLERRRDAHFISPPPPKRPCFKNRAHYGVLAPFSSLSAVLPRREHSFHIMLLAICSGVCLSHALACLALPPLYFIILILSVHVREVLLPEHAHSFLEFFLLLSYS